MYLAYLTRYLSTAEGVYIVALNTFQARKKCAFPDLDFCHFSRYSPLTKITQRRTPTGRSRSTSAPSCARCPTRTTRSWNAGAGMADAEISVVQDVHLGGHPVCLIGIESRPVPRRGFPPADGPDAYTAGYAVPAVVEEDRPGDQRRLRQPASGGAREPVGLRRVAGVDAQAAAGVRRGDRPGGRQLPGNPPGRGGIEVVIPESAGLVAEEDRSRGAPPCSPRCAR